MEVARNLTHHGFRSRSGVGDQPVMEEGRVKKETDVKIEEQKPKETQIVATKVSGVVKWFNVKNGYGFVTRTDNQTAIASHNTRKAVPSIGDGEVKKFLFFLLARFSRLSSLTWC